MRQEICQQEEATRQRPLHRLSKGSGWDGREWRRGSFLKRICERWRQPMMFCWQISRSHMLTLAIASNTKAHLGGLPDRVFKANTTGVTTRCYSASKECWRGNGRKRQQTRVNALHPINDNRLCSGRRGLRQKYHSRTRQQAAGWRMEIKPAGGPISKTLLPICIYPPQTWPCALFCITPALLNHWA